ncbi:hypothetical protein [Elizabethkingia anophelis]|uniref:DUF2303 family protein n=1 Tax=Elizabethkingia anophelis TaxID=1117645 RepID=A0A7Z7PVJ7_9FLAO|nr:hypothetical protein [Elizabethkingia anophelis]MDV3704759.1 hypothetical protein [Elizabethkingia anophelis]STC97877.1 Uncharacterised protein [Elizabethkingia anophelis]
MDNKLNITVENGVKTLFIGQALTPKEALQFEASGDINAVKTFLEKRNVSNAFQGFNKDYSVIIFNKEKLSIQLFINPNDELATIINAKGEYSNELQEFGINQNKMFNWDQLIKILRFNRRFFPNKEENANLLRAYQSFTATVNKQIENTSDLRGNKIQALNKQIKTDLPESFVISIPIFKNSVPVSFPVEICIEETDAGVRFWFESIELSELLELRVDEIFREQLEYFEALGIPVIQK